LRQATASKFKWGNVDAKDGVMVEIAPVEALLQSWVPLSRAYGWGVPLETITLLGGRIGGKAARMELRTGLAEVQGCCWLSVKGDDGALGAESMFAEALRGLPIVAKALEAQAVSAASSSSPLSDACYHVLVPMMCLRRAETGAGGWLSHQVGTALAPADVQPGMLVRLVGSQTALERACDRFEWWDRPPPRSVAAMVGQVAEVISTCELPSRGRVGVRLLHVELFDAVPLEALLPMEEAAAAATSATQREGEKEEQGLPGISAKITVRGKKKAAAGRKPPVVVDQLAGGGYQAPLVLADDASSSSNNKRPKSAPARRNAPCKQQQQQRGEEEVVVAGESERIVNEFYLSELRSPPPAPFGQGGNGGGGGGGRMHADAEAVAVAVVPETNSPILSEEPALPRQPDPSNSSNGNNNKARVSLSMVSFDAEHAQWAIPPSPSRPGQQQRRRRRSPVKRAAASSSSNKAKSGKNDNNKPRPLSEEVGENGNDDYDHDKDKDAASSRGLFVQQLGTDSIHSENYQNGVAGPGRRDNGKAAESRRQRRPKTAGAAGAERVVGRAVLASKDNVDCWTDGEGAFMVEGHAGLGARQQL
jgi:hypothetical protein